MAAYTVSQATSHNIGDKKVLICRITGDNTAYTANGDAVDPGWFGMQNVDYIVFQPFDSSGVNHPLFIKGATDKIYQQVMGTGNEFSGNNTFVFDVMVYGV